MKEFIEKLIGRLKEEKSKDVCDSISCIECHQRYKNDSSDTCYKPIQMLAYDNAIEIVNQLAEEYNNGWIPCSERLPDKKGTYLVTVEKFGVTFARFTGQKDNLHFDANVIAWQPLPEPYQPKGE